MTACLNLGGTVIFSQGHSLLLEIMRHAPDVVLMVPATAEQVLNQIDGSFRKSGTLALGMGGAAVSPVLRRRLLELLATEISELYASNEAAGISLVGEDGVGTILADVEVEIVDDAGRVVPYGEAGAIRVRGSYPSSMATCTVRNRTPSGSATAGTIRATRASCPGLAGCVYSAATMRHQCRRHQAGA